MQIKLVGAVLIFAVCSGFGFYLAEKDRQDVKCLRYLLYSLDYMGNELQYHMTPLPQLLRQTAAQCHHKSLSHIFLQFSHQLEDKYCGDFSECTNSVMRQCKYPLPGKSYRILNELCRTMGRFDLEGQINSIMSVKASCLNEYDALRTDLTTRTRNYRTLGICAGAAIVILFI